MLWSSLDTGSARHGIQPIMRECKTMYISIGGDTETFDGDANTFQLSYGENKICTFCDETSVTRLFLEKLDLLPRTRGRVYIIWFHNLAFDLAVLFPRLLKLFYEEEFCARIGGWEFTGVYSQVVFATLRKLNITIHLYGTDSYFKTSLANLATIYCPTFPKLRYPRGLGEKRFTSEDRRFIAYAQRDADITEVVGQKIIDMHEEFGIPISVSAPHMASRIFRKHFIRAAIPLPPTPLLYASLHSYHGGKNNFPVVRGYYENISCLDIKSAYPFAMSQFPSFYRRDLYREIAIKDYVNPVSSFGIYKCSGIAFPTPWPCVFDHAFKPIIGRFSNVWITGYEYNRILESRLAVFEKVSGYFYDAKTDTDTSPFKAYVDHFFKLKESAPDKGSRNFYKLLLNSLYGKFIETRSSEVANLNYDIEKDSITFDNHLKAGALFNPFVASLITGHTRSYIHALECGFKSIHTSTDGIMTHENYAAKSGNDLGSLSVEARGDVLLLRNKLYVVYTRERERAAVQQGDPIKSTLYPQQFIQKYALHGFFGNVHELESIVKTGVYEYEYTKVNKLRESLRRNLKVNRFEKQRRKLNLE